MARQEMWGTEKQGVTGMATGRERSFGGRVASDTSWLHLHVHIAVWTQLPAMSFPQKPRVSILNDGNSLKNYFKSLWKPKEKAHRLMSMRRSAFFNGDACPVWSPLARCGCWATQEDQVRIELSPDCKITLDFDDYKIRQPFESTVC